MSNAMVLFGVKKCMCYACDPIVRLDAPSICFVCVFVCRMLSPHLRAGSQVFTLLMMFLCLTLQQPCILPFDMTCPQNYVGRYGGLSESRLHVLCEPGPLSFPSAGES